MSHSPAVNKPAPHIDDVPPKRSRDFADLTHAFFALVLGIGVILFSVYLHGTASGVESDVHSAGRVVSWLMDVPRHYCSSLPSYASPSACSSSCLLPKSGCKA